MHRPVHAMIAVVGALACSGLPASRAEAASGPPPVEEFLTAAARLGSSPARLDSLVRAHSLLVGTAVGVLLDTFLGVDPGAEDSTAAALAADRALRLAAATADSARRRVLLDRIVTETGWDADARTTRARALRFETTAREKRDAQDFDGALADLIRARELYAAIDDRRSIARVLGSEGVVRWYAGDWEGVERAYRSALRARRAIDDAWLVAKTLNGLGSVHYQLGEDDEALRWYEQAIRLRRRIGDRVGLATSLQYAANCHIRQGRLVEAKRLLERARPVLEAEGDARTLVELFNTLGNLYEEMGRSAEAAQAYGEALSRIDAAPDYAPVIRLNRAASLRHRNRLRAALAELDRAFDGFEAAEIPVEMRYQRRRERGLALLEMGEIEAAGREFERCAAWADSLGRPLLRIETGINRAHLELQAGRAEVALSRADSAVALAEQASEKGLYADAQRVAVAALRELGRPEEALVRLRPLLVRERAEGRQRDVLEFLIAEGNLESELGRGDTARAAFREADRLLRELDLPSWRWIPRLGIGDTFEDSDPDSARWYYRRAVEDLEAHRSAVGTGAVRTAYLSAERGRVFEQVVDFLARQQQRDPDGRWSTEAFATAERARARGLLDLVQAGVDPSADSTLVADLDRLYALGPATPDDREERSRLQDRLSRRWGQLIEEAAPGASAAALVDDPATVSARLEPGQVALVYSLGTERSWMWVIDDRGHDLVELPARSVLEREIVDLREALAAPGFGDRLLARRARELHRQLVESGGARVDRARRLSIVPAGILYELPFELLLTEDFEGKGNWKKARFLADRWPVTYGPSASVLVGMQERSARAVSDRVLVVGDPDYAGLQGSGPPLPSLPGTRAEAAAVARIASAASEVLTGVDATEGRLRRALRSAPAPSILHLATHGLVDRAEPSLSCVVLAPDPRTGDDGYLYSLEILALPLRAELVVLSACDTGRGKLERGEGNVGLTRSFLAGGARRVVASLWPVADASTAEFMRVFYREALKKGHPVDEALQRARRALYREKETAHPYYWAPFVLFGDGRAVGEGLRR